MKNWLIILKATVARPYNVVIVLENSSTADKCWDHCALLSGTLKATQIQAITNFFNDLFM